MDLPSALFVLAADGTLDVGLRGRHANALAR